MSAKVSKKSSQKMVVRAKRKRRIRAGLSGTGERPRLAVFRSNRYLYAQIVDDAKGHTVAAASTQEEEFRNKKLKNNLEGAKTLGEMMAKRALAKGVKAVVFDRGGYLYHGRIKSFADAAREAGLKF
jgi:large subunit ribosomal protein L18